MCNKNIRFHLKVKCIIHYTPMEVDPYITLDLGSFNMYIDEIKTTDLLSIIVIDGELEIRGSYRDDDSNIVSLLIGNNNIIELFETEHSILLFTIPKISIEPISKLLKLGIITFSKKANDVIIKINSSIKINITIQNSIEYNFITLPKETQLKNGNYSIYNIQKHTLETVISIIKILNITSLIWLRVTKECLFLILNDKVEIVIAEQIINTQGYIFHLNPKILIEYFSTICNYNCAVSMYIAENTPMIFIGRTTLYNIRLIVAPFET